MNILKKYVLIVIYNKSCENLPINKIIQKIENAAVIIYDNSLKDYGNENYCRKNEWIYLGGDGNKGLSFAYNAAVKYCRNQRFDGILCIFDDDTEISSEYFRVLESSIQEDPSAELFIPILKSNNKIISPSILRSNYTCKLFESESNLRRYRGTRLTAFNSGLAIKTDMFDSLIFDEKLFLDFIDHRFFQEINKRKIKYHILAYVSGHNFSGEEHPGITVALQRFEIFIKDASVFCEHKRYLFHLLVMKRTLRLTFEYRTDEFIRITLNS